MKTSGNTVRHRLLSGLMLMAVLVSAPIRALDPPPTAWVLSLTWWPESCYALKRAGNAAACGAAQGFVVRGLSAKENIDAAAACAEPAALSDALMDELIRRMAPLIPDAETVREQWKQFGTCSGLAAETYFARVEEARRAVQMPDSFLSGRANQRISKTQFEEAFLETNPGMGAEALTIECRSHYLTEVRVCLDGDMKPRTCGADVGDICEREIIIRPR
ncbi:MAG: ribonuclease T2 family protein [Panacagrimonas sp.]